MTAFARRIFSFDEQRQLPQGLAKSRTGEVSKEENSKAIDANIEDEKWKPGSSVLQTECSRIWFGGKSEAKQNGFKSVHARPCNRADVVQNETENELCSFEIDPDENFKNEDSEDLQSGTVISADSSPKVHQHWR